MGTFRARFTLQTTTGNTFTTGGAGNDAFHGYTSSGLTVKTGSIVYALIGNCFYLDGAIIPIPFAGLPSGFTLAGPVDLSCPGFGGLSYLVAADANPCFDGTVAGTTVASGQWGSYNTSVTANLANQNKTLALVGITLTDLIDLLTFLELTLTVTPQESTITPGQFSGNNATAVDVIDVEGNYTIVSTAWTISPSTLALPANTLTITRPTLTTPPDDDTEAIEAIWINDKKIKPTDPWVVLWLRFQIVIHFPPIENDGTGVVTISASIRGTTFSGKVALGIISVTYANLSGIYQLDADAFTDTIYTRSGTTTSTTEVAIPSPFLITYFIDDNDANILHYTGTRMRVTGQGTLGQIFMSLDSVNTEQLANLTLKSSNNLSPFSLSNFIDQQGALRVFTSTSEAFMNVSQIIIFSKEMFTGYPQ